MRNPDQVEDIVCVFKVIFCQVGFGVAGQKTVNALSGLVVGHGRVCDNWSIDLCLFLTVVHCHSTPHGPDWL
jgi:hypothetical protein